MDFKNSYQRKKSTNNLISLFVINTIVLFFLSVAILTYLKSSSIENYFKENITVSIYLKNSSRDSDIKQINKFLNLNENVKSIEFISKEDAAELFTNEIGEEFVGFLGYNPLLDLISVRLFGDKIDIYNIEEFIESLDNFQFIEEIEYDKPLVESLVNNFNKIGVLIIITSVLFFITSFILINNSIKISIYSKRDIIKTMQLVGATKSFIRRPFIASYIRIGFYSSIISLILLFILLSQTSFELAEIDFFSNIKDIIILVSFIILFGIFTSYISSYFITQKYLKLKISR
ncbi:MAG: cell division protein FtsX [Candidatus Marisimplicoccus sp.]|jgi:cell division transport system permease protein|tara:strand:- start:353 stop:1219 length:867 start_codon:yes stop_codon:yes gene_type:complete